MTVPGARIGCAQRRWKQGSADRGDAFEPPAMLEDRDAGRAAIEAAALALEPVRRALDGRPVKKIVIVPQRIVNVVG